MITLKIALLHHQNPGSNLIQKGKKQLHQIFQACSYTITDKKPDILFFISGGSEQNALEFLKNDRFPLLMAGKENNALAAAIEVYAWCKDQQKPAALFNYQHPDALNDVKEYVMVKRALESLKNKNIGIIGQPSDWLINSTVSPEKIKNITGLNLKQYLWPQMPSFEAFDCPDSFLTKFSGSSNNTLEGSGKVYAMLKAHLHREHLDGITVECFSLVKEKHVTACLPLALLNDEGTPAACEGDTVSLVGMMILQALTGKIPWMANIVEIGDDHITLAHCTVPMDLLSDHYITTHYETGEGTAVKGHLQNGKYTLVRFNKHLDQLFVSEATTLEGTELAEACRTQVTFAVNKNDAKLLKEKPLGNHHLILPGWYANILKKMAEIMQLNDNLGGCPKITW